MATCCAAFRPVPCSRVNAVSKARVVGSLSPFVCSEIAVPHTWHDPVAIVHVAVSAVAGTNGVLGQTSRQSTRARVPAPQQIKPIHAHAVAHP